jgi:HEAT repeats/HEAT repeat
MSGFEIFVLLVGAVVGGCAVYAWQETRINRLEKEHKKALRRMVDSVERNYAERKFSSPQPNTQSASLSDIQGLLPTIMQDAAAPTPTAPVVLGYAEPRSSPKEQNVSSVIASLPTKPVDRSEPEEQLLATQIFDEPPFEIAEPVAAMPSSIASSMVGFVAIATATPILTNKITAKIAMWGQLANPKYIPQILGYANHPDASVREQVATGLGQIAAANAIHAYTPLVMPILEQLSRDRHLNTRYKAIVALGQIKSERVIPILTSALREPSSKLVKAASNALNKMKCYAPSEPQPLELPKQVIDKKPLRC